MTLRIILAVTVVLLAVGLLVISQRRTEPLKVSGFIEADEIRLGSRVGGRVARVKVQEGQQVKVGQELVLLEEFDLDERSAQAKANLAARRADWERLSAGFRVEETAQAKARYEQLQAMVRRLVAGPRKQEIEAARAQLALAEAHLLRAKQSHARITALFQQRRGAVTEDDLDRSTEEFKVAQAMQQVRQQQLKLLVEGTRVEEIDEAQAQLEQTRQAWLLMAAGYRKEEVQQAKAAMQAADAALAAIDAQRDELIIRSPVEGVVEAMELQPGDLVAAGAPVLSLMDTSNLWVRAYVPLNRLTFDKGQQLRVTVDSLPDQTLTGTVTFISRQAEFTPSNVQTSDERAKQVFRIKITLTNNHSKLRPGMAADVWLEE